MLLWFRMLLLFLATPRRAVLAAGDVGRRRMRVWPTDIDVLGHLNNGRYLSLMDLGRFDLLIRAGMWSTLRAQGIYPVVVAETISFRRSLDVWVRFELETRVIGWDDHVVFLEQRFVRHGELHARGVIAARFLRRSGGTVPTAELMAILGIDDARATPEWVRRWAADARLPSNRVPTPSVWEDDSPTSPTSPTSPDEPAR